MNYLPYIVILMTLFQLLTAAPPLPEPDCGTRPHKCTQLYSVSGVG